MKNKILIDPFPMYGELFKAAAKTAVKIVKLKIKILWKKISTLDI